MEDHPVAVSHHDATPASGNIEHHISGRNFPRPWLLRPYWSGTVHQLKQRWSVKPSAKPTQVRTLDLPPVNPQV